MFKPNSLYYVDAYKISHKRMLAPGTTKLYGTWISRSLKHAPKGIDKIVSFGQQLVVRWLHDEFQENFFNISWEKASQFGKDMSMMLMQDYDDNHFKELHKLGYLPIKIKSLLEGIETNPNIPHMTFINTVDGFAWLTLYLETIISSLAWKPSTSATIALKYRRNALEWVKKTDPDNLWLVDYICHDFSARGLNPHDMLSSGLGHATSFRGSDTLIVIPGARYYYDEPENEVCINSVNASEHSVSTTKIFTVGEKQMIIDWLKEFPKGILSIVADTFDLWKLLVEYLADPEVKALIMARDGKLVIRPDSGDPVDIICGKNSIINFKSDDFDELKNKKETFIFINENIFYTFNGDNYREILEEYGEQCYDGLRTIKDFIDNGIVKKLNKKPFSSEQKGVIELLWDTFGGTTNKQGFKVLDPHIGAIYGDSITLDRQIQIYERLASKGFASTNIVLGVGSFTYQYNTRDTFGWAAKGAWFEIDHRIINPEEWMDDGLPSNESFDIYKDPVTDDGTKKSLKGLICVLPALDNKSLMVIQQCKKGEEKKGLLQVIYEDGKYYNQTTLKQVRERLKI